MIEMMPYRHFMGIYPSSEGKAPLIFRQDTGTDRERVMCGIVIALGRQHPHETMELMSAKFQPGPMPHPLVLETLAGLALANREFLLLYLSPFCNFPFFCIILKMCMVSETKS